MPPVQSSALMGAILPNKGVGDKGMDSSQPLLRMEQIDKQYPGVHALDNVDFELFEGEVHVLLGENGAGKSTLVKILSGSIQKDSGRIFIRGQEIQNINPERAQELGIGMVYQELSLIPALTVAENIFLGQWPRKTMRVVDWDEMYRKARESLTSLGVNIDPHLEVRQLEVAEQQLTEIARVLTKQPEILLLDEPTSALSNVERSRLFEILNRLRKRGVGIVYISHLLAEVPLVGQRVTVLRDGKVIGTLPVNEAAAETLINMMVGRKLTEQYPKENVSLGDTALRVEDLSVDGVLHNLSFEIHRGEILGIFGLMGAGQAEFARAIFGLLPISSGQIFVNGQAVRIRHSSDAISQGLGLLTRDRRESLVPMLPIPPNISLANVSQFPFFRTLNLRTELATAGRYARELRILPSRLDRAVMYLSGGNQQKVVLARWLFSEAKILIFDEPTRGIDVGAKAEVFALMNDLTRRGVGIVMISSEMPEILAMADRILVMREGSFTAEYKAGEATQEELLRSAS
ncbi:MAG TPA: sugar ABC transporter ATP-binding protein [Candidatus Bathyarchaeia archaeon]|nr:sugar ABC transporter ATP-binding protein [Candidatus Bathyarchaeia archaeon]